VKLLALLLLVASGLRGDEYVPRYAVYDLWPDGKPRTIIATLANGEGVAGIAAFAVAADGSLQHLASLENGAVSIVQVRDVTGDGRPEILSVLPSTVRGTSLDVLSWDGTSFTRLGVTNEQADFVDLDGDGVPEILERSADGTKPVIRKIQAGRFAETAMPGLGAAITVTKSRNDPREFFEQSVVLPKGFPRKCFLSVVNGTPAPTGVEVSFGACGQEPRTVAPGNVVFPDSCAFVDITVSGPRGATATVVVTKRR
jgi:hypothetical protein